ncbi:hypothetical protein K2173_016529 [Erythroxylum novogranatense]|uniref:Las1-like family protein n=1 Tax=Erythroxylum novogranatense TaxID=1862640 RepID=A0AAV8SGG8_9ROSI|nr:hypothetical protein K2173_016529 [Erythroxylum novogranatense]
MSTAPEVGSLFNGFEEDVVAVNGEDNHEKSSLSCSYKLVPWLNWKEWEKVRDSLFSDSPHKIDFALKRISTWRSRGCLPVVVDVTASIIEIQHKDPFFRKDLLNDSICSEQMLAMLYCMAILRLVNCVVEKTRKKTEISIAEAAGAIGIPRVLIDIRHEGSHRDLPGLPLVRDSAIKALHWLKSYYWEPQRKQIPSSRDETANIKAEIKSKLLELVSSLKVKQSPQPGLPSVKGKRGKQCEHLCGRSKFFSLMACKLHSSKSGGPKKQSMKTLKMLVRLYSSFSSEVLSVLLEFLLKALNSPNLVEPPENFDIGQDLNNLLNDWKVIITKFANKEPEALLLLLKAVLDVIEQEFMKYGFGMRDSSLECRAGTNQIGQLVSVFAWLVGQVKERKLSYGRDTEAEFKFSSRGKQISKAILMEVLRKCLALLPYGDTQLTNSVLNLALVMGDNSLMEKLNKLSLVGLSESDTRIEDPSSSCSSTTILEDESINQASKKLELVRLRKSRAGETRDDNVGCSGRWVVAKSWNPCPIGMLPVDLGSSGRLPDLDIDSKSADSKMAWEHRRCGNMREADCEIKISDDSNVRKLKGKREVSCNVNALDLSSAKKMRETLEIDEPVDQNVVLPQGINGCLMIDGAWKKVGEEEVRAIQSGIRILV